MISNDYVRYIYSCQNNIRYIAYKNQQIKFLFSVPENSKNGPTLFTIINCVIFNDDKHRFGELKARWAGRHRMVSVCYY